ncbi:glycerol-3-phosphate dehydrogenase/oxidase [Gordonia jinhuaensis]|uniref:Glycerol-3-phosphate dehydrogenase n=1 Tax=Gordonia jinhuaensis TaxID=1517702 RepID=A0A916WT50_9ACTN|nr:glycerol-3-phosphate dehydrogenase/oxidase [Gordonia jinhuaensis]GGB27274.1 glycerol-3-phosphate dehydrogenase [Gordonia jinhuaensis]
MNDRSGTTNTTRRAAVAAIADRPHAQVLIIGGGINGISTFRDLAMQGIDVIIAERNDWVSGASSASSHMIHGGIRYLENGEFRLVKESVHERNGLLKIAPHYVKPLETTIPIFSTFSGILNAPRRFLTHNTGKPNERGALLIEAGLQMYDAYSGAGSNRVPRHKFRVGKKAREDMPRLNADLKYTATYFDASVHDPERLALDVLKDGLGNGSNARAANYLEAVGVADGGVTLRDNETGDEFVVTADVIMNCSGPWTDITNSDLGGSTKYMGGTKGSHIVLEHPELLAATRGRELFFEHEDGRIVLIYPLKGRVLVGTTDIDADPSKPTVCTDAEIEYFIDLIHHVFPEISVSPEQIVYSFSGIRPLPRHDDTTPGFVSRDYNVQTTTIPGVKSTVFSLVGGKWTTFRALGEQVSDHILEALGKPRRTSTVGVPIGGGHDYPIDEVGRIAWVETHRGSLSETRAAALFERYGTRATEVIDAIEAGSDEPLAESGLSTAELRYMVEREFAAHVIDIVLRRTDLAFTGKVTTEALREIADAMGDILGWDAAKRSAEIDDAVAVLRDAHRVTVGATSVAS